ncbi:MAG: amidohydrolase [Candidatus Anstonellales archaeon]
MLLIKNVLIVTQNAKREILRGNILIEGNKIKSVGSAKKLEGAREVIDGQNLVAIPGFINTSTHIPMTFFRGYGGGLPLQEWLEKKIWPAERKLTNEDLYWGAMLGIAESLHSGITTFLDMYIKDINYIGKAIEHSGIRGFISLGMMDVGGISGGISEQLKKTEEVRRRWEKSERVSVAVACHAPYTCSAELIKEAKNYANKHGLVFHIHAAETRKEVFDILKENKMRVIEYLDSLGVLDDKTILAHASWVTKREIGIVAKRGAHVSANTISNLKLATGGICPLLEYKNAGANVTLATDGASSNNSLNMFETMKVSSLLQKHSHWDAKAISAQDALDFATINGAKALGINAGSIEEGKLADIVLLKLDSNLIPIHDIVDNIVYAGNPSNVAYVIVDGRVVLRNGRLTFFDENEAKKQVQIRAERLCR